MLNNIKNMILEKKAYLEEAEILFEGAALENIDDLIILNESTSEDLIDDKDDIEDDDDNLDDETSKEDSDDDEEKEDTEGEDDVSIDDSDDEEITKDAEEDDMMDLSLDDNEIQSSSLDTDGSSVNVDNSTNGDNFDVDDFLNITLDLKSNTTTDILPVPPNNASEAISDDILSTRINSGFESSSFNEGMESILKDLKSTGKDGWGKVVKLWRTFINFLRNKVKEFRKKILKIKDYECESVLTIKEIGETYELLKPIVSTDTKAVAKLNKIETKLDSKTVKKFIISDDDLDYLEKTLEKLSKIEERDLGKVKKDVVNDETSCDILSIWKRCISKLNNIIVKILSNLIEIKDAEIIQESNNGGYPMGVEEKKDPDEDDLFSEAISLDGDGGDPNETPPSDGTDTGEQSTDEPPVEENDVTTAVKDKVAEADAPIESDGTKVSGQEILQKLSNITKSLEDAKKAVMNTIQ